MSELPDDAETQAVLAAAVAAADYRRREAAAGRPCCTSLSCMELPGPAVALLDTGIAKLPVCRACADDLAEQRFTLLPLAEGD